MSTMTSARLQEIYEDKNQSIDLRRKAWKELHARWKQQPRPPYGFGGGIITGYYSNPIHFMPQP